MAAPALSKKAATSSTSGVTWPVQASTVSPQAAIKVHSWENSRYLRRSTISAITPDGSANRNIGRLLAACTSATASGSALRVSMLQFTPTSFIHEPILETTVAIQSMRNTGLRSGCNGEISPAAWTSGCSCSSWWISLTCAMTNPLMFHRADSPAARPGQRQRGKDNQQQPAKLAFRQ